jgi:hypothetical protein
VKRFFAVTFVLFCVFAAASRPSVAHHSMSAYDSGRTVSMKATITKFDWTNPHVQIHFDVRDDSGSVSQWMAECPSPNRLSRAGWSEDTLKTGDQVTVTGNPAKDGAKEMRLNAVALPNGQELTAHRR